MPRSALVLLPMALMLGGCLARAAVDVATAPVKVVGKAADWATTSQDEADRNRGREIRQREERLGRLGREYESLTEDCDDGDDRACREAVSVRREMDALGAAIPARPSEEN